MAASKPVDALTVAQVAKARRWMLAVAWLFAVPAILLTGTAAVQILALARQQPTCGVYICSGGGLGIALLLIPTVVPVSHAIAWFLLARRAKRDPGAHRAALLVRGIAFLLLPALEILVAVQNHLRGYNAPLGLYSALAVAAGIRSLACLPTRPRGRSRT